MILSKRLCRCSLLKGNTKRLVFHGIVSGFVTVAFLFLMLLSVNNYNWLPNKFGNTDILNYLKGQKMHLIQQEELDSEQDREPDNMFPGLYHFKYIINEPKKCQKNSPFLILLIAVQAWQSEARQAIRQTWGNEDFVPGIQIVRLFLLGKDATSNIDVQQALVNESRKYHDIIQQEYLDTYNNLTLKTLMGLRWVATYCPQIPYVMKTDSDMFVNTEYLINKLLIPDQPPQKNYFTGYLMRGFLPNRNTDSKWYMAPSLYPGERYPTFCSGTGYVFSGDLAEKIFKVSASVTFLHLEDVFVGVCLDKIGVSPVPPPKESDFNHWKVSYSDCYYNQIVTTHQFEPAELISTWKSLQKNKHTCV
ncbi:beta-1,3-galactosyltransferase 2-like [Hyla sarda]|uniref:beta-1,3-galactosyltransferase 2-like n=1 Tax=Hyla sarda TaxID=327740 RepID=UPI0024C4313B|nr:beta-1,3-galactosyltransferase 2-like [Hyla sarda]XP_056379640.1 beta-1,3-galactosyltransferase 2-like [Hyla sarda]XP_056379641.1 beta-1,3-galactosyltransferase 2-like [Hyla sarda]XP_056379642.1 beta-1,3-galactosyltransferase 2-like [Hyla sarda]XP_056379643.1 beta-1,3-galactosyltransferase 2-like [Hyla sarda]